MHLVTPEGRWTAPAGQFAARIRAGDLPGVFTKEVVVDFGVRAVLLEDGEILGELRPGTHILDSLAERLGCEPRRQTAVVVVREEEIPLEFAERALQTRDAQMAYVGLRASVQADDLTVFLKNVLGAKDCLALEELRSLLAPVFTEQLAEEVGRRTLKDLLDVDTRRRLALVLSKEDEAIRHYGLRLGPVLAVSIRQKEQSSQTSATADVTSASQPPLESSCRLRKSGQRMICSFQAFPNIVKPAAAFSPEVRSGEILVNSLGMCFAPIPSGSFMMGSPGDEPERSGAEDQHLVEITRPFHLGVNLVAQDEYRSIMGADPSCFFDSSRPGSPIQVGDSGQAKAQVAALALPRVATSLPVERISWDQASEFCLRLSELPAEKATERVYRLPTEAEWEYACRAGSPWAYGFGSSLNSKDANFGGNCTSPVSAFRPNAWGLHDMHGNLWEWCADWFCPDYYRQSPSLDPSGPATGFARVLRGGSWRSRAGQCRSAARYSARPTHRHDGLGFRVVCISP